MRTKHAYTHEQQYQAPDELCASTKLLGSTSSYCTMLPYQPAAVKLQPRWGRALWPARNPINTRDAQSPL